NLGCSFRTQGSQNVGAAGSNIRNIDTRAFEGSWATHDTAMRILLFAEATGNFTQALGIEANVSTHVCQRGGIAKTVLIDGLMHNRHPLGLGQQDRKWLLPVRHKARMDVGLQRNSWRDSAITDKANAFIINLKTQLHLRECVEEGQQGILLSTVDID